MAYLLMLQYLVLTRNTRYYGKTPKVQYREDIYAAFTTSRDAYFMHALDMNYDRQSVTIFEHSSGTSSATTTTLSGT